MKQTNGKINSKMTDEHVKWSNTCKRFVAFMDIMGFKEMLLRKSHKEVLKIMKDFKPIFDIIERDANHKLNPTKSSKAKYVFDSERCIIRSLSFSDSVIFLSSDDSLDSANALLFWIYFVLGEALSLGIPLKGAVAYGEQTADFDNSLHFGRPLIDAYELQNELYLYGAVLHHTMEKYLTETGMMPKLENIVLFKWPTPLKSGRITHYLVGWPSIDDMVSKLPSISQRLYGSVSGSARFYVDNTVEFINWLRERKTKV